MLRGIVKVFGSKTGFYATNIVYYSDTRTLLIDPVRDFQPGEVWKVCSEFGDTVIGSSFVGLADTIVFHLDNNDIPVITNVETPQVEKSGAFEIKFVAFDQERDLLRFQVEFISMLWRLWKKEGVSLEMLKRWW